tara:strand:- start:3784 stop:4284 length:501 start_codon:yes stop_codon:yes gene_type:complete
MIQIADTLNTLTYVELIARVALAGIFGALLGLDRDAKGKPVDFRAFMIVCISTCLVAILGQELFFTYKNEAESEFLNLDLGKIIAGALTGIGFLGAGAIIQNCDEQKVVGTATGAGIWGSAIIGLCLGFGQLILALTGFIIIGIILFFAGRIFSYLKTLQQKNSPK